jgi:WD40 repeat protein
MPPLLDLLGASWSMGAPVVGAAWDVDASAVAFALGDGHLAVTAASWPQGPRVERRPGNVAVSPAELPAPRPVRVACHPGSCLCIAADAHGGFLSGGDDGRVVSVPRRGAPTVLAHLPGAWIDTLACGAGGTRVHAGGRRVHRTDSGGEATIELPAPATAVAFSPDGRSLAVAHSGGVTLWAGQGAPRRLAWRGYHRALAWSPDGRFVVTGMQENTLHGWRVADGGDMEMGGYPGQPLSLSFSHDGRYLATSGATRAVCWGFDPPGRQDRPAECGPPSKTPVTCVACHPQWPAIAAGYHNGAVLLCQPGGDDALFIRGAGGGAVNALAWSGDGNGLAFGTQDGALGWLQLPQALFNRRAEPRQVSKETMT